MISLVLGFVVAFLLAALPGRAAIARLRKLNAKQNVSADAPAAHGKKQGTPTMGGLLILFALTGTVLGVGLPAAVGRTSPSVGRLHAAAAAADDAGVRGDRLSSTTF